MGRNGFCMSVSGIKCFVLKVGFFNDILYIAVYILLILFGEIADDDWFTVFDGYMGAADKWHVLFQYVVGVVDYHRDNGAA